MKQAGAVRLVSTGEPTTARPPKPAASPPGAIKNGTAASGHPRSGWSLPESPRRADEPGWSVRVVTSEPEFAGLEASWSELHARCVDRSVFLSHEWVYSWWTAYRPRAELAIVVVEDGGRPVGIAPMMITDERRAGFTVRVLRFIGDANEATGHIRETDHIGLIVAGEARAEVVHMLLAAVARLRWDAAEFNQVPEASETTRELLAWTALMKLACEIEVVPCPVRRLPSTYEALLASLPSRLRTSVRSSRRKLQQQHAFEFGLHVREDALDEALATFFRNHESRWRGKGQEGAFVHPARRLFYALLTPRLLRRGWLRFFHLTLDGRVVAQQYCFAVDGTVMLLQEGFDFAHAQDNVGNVLRACVFEHLIESGAECYDFLAGDSRHKQSWSDGVVNDLRIACARPTWRGWLCSSLPRARSRVSAALQRWQDRLQRRSRAPA
jgi:CelD/BcsL family acetyltransferase involved in cellulose biosynthesis